LLDNFGLLGLSAQPVSAKRFAAVAVLLAGSAQMR